MAACAPGREGSDSAAGTADDPTSLDPITANDDFYTVAISGWQPDEAWLSAWALTITDPDGNSFTLSLDEIAAVGTSEEERTLSCIGSRSGYATGNAVWTVVSFEKLLAFIGVSSDAPYLRFTSGDGYSTTLPRTDVAAGLGLAVGMNGVPLPAAHGAPLRALVPGRYGMKNPKWIERIDLVNEWEAGFWESKGWSDSAEYQVLSWFIKPDEYATAERAGAYIHGIAFAGERGISRVELSEDGGLTWFEAEIVYPGGPGVWTIWRLSWVPQTTGEVTLQVRATAADGTVQADVETSDADLDGLEQHDRRVFVVV